MFVWALISSPRAYLSLTKPVCLFFEGVHEHKYSLISDISCRSSRDTSF